MIQKVSSNSEVKYTTTEKLDKKKQFFKDINSGNRYTVDELPEEDDHTVEQKLNEIKQKAQSLTKKKPIEYGSDYSEEPMLDGSKYTERLDEYKNLTLEYDKLQKELDAVKDKLGYYKKENHYKDVTNSEYRELDEKLEQIDKRREKIYTEIEKSIAKSPMGSKFKCGDYIIEHTRAFTDKDGNDRYLFLSNFEHILNSCSE